jgi:hypothetical protein
MTNKYISTRYCDCTTTRTNVVQVSTRIDWWETGLSSLMIHECCSRLLCGIILKL